MPGTLLSISSFGLDALRASAARKAGQQVCPLP
jgi:hypothetical protein